MRRRLMITSLFVCLFAAGSARAQNPLLLVVHTGANELGMYDAKTYKLLGTAPTGRGPHEVDVSPDGRYAYVTDYGAIDNTISIIDIAKRKRVGGVNLKPNWRPHGLVVSNDGKHVYATCEASRSVAEVDVAARKVSRSFQTGEFGTHMIALTPDGKYLMTSNREAATATVIEIARGERVRNLVVGKGCEGIAFRPDGKEAWVVNAMAQNISIVDTETWMETVAIPCPGYPNRIVFSSDGKFVYANSPTMGLVRKYDAGKRSQVAEAVAGQRPIGMVLDGSDKRLFVANFDEATVSVLDTSSFEVIDNFETGESPDGIVWVGRR